MSKTLRALIAVSLLALLFAAIGTMVSLPDRPMEGPASTTITSAVKLSMPIDLSGKWRSVEGTKVPFIAEIKDGKIHLDMLQNKSVMAFWYGTFDILQPGEKVVSSKAIKDENVFVLSSSDTKDFLYQGDSLVFDYTIVGIRTTVEMKRG